MSQRRVLVQMRIPRGAPLQDVRRLASQLSDYGFDWDPDYLIPMESAAGGSEEDREDRKEQAYRSVILRGRIEEGRESDLEARSDIIRVWSDAPIAPLAHLKEKAEIEDKDKEEADHLPASLFTF